MKKTERSDDFMAAAFQEDNTTERMLIDALKSVGWTYVEAEQLPRTYSDVMVEPMVRDALIRLNPCVAEEPSRADEIIYKLRAVILSVQPHNFVSQNEAFKRLIFEENFYPFGRDGRMVPVRFFGTVTKENLALNEYVVTNQWIYPRREGARGSILFCWRTVSPSPLERRNLSAATFVS